ncbi:MAG: WG repeat-containing protein, partial [Bacteroidales bacterium]|nr:WG repeat-containing protein [Bacteroidales bacterium]
NKSWAAAKPFNYGRAWVGLENNLSYKYGCINESGEYVIPPVYSSMGNFTYINGILQATVEKNKYIYYLDINGKTLKIESLDDFYDE